MLEKNDKATLLLEIIDAIDEIKQFKGLLDDIDIPSLKSIKGEKGDKGERGDKGETGEKGDLGESGKDYVFTETDKKKIIREVLSRIPVPDEIDVKAIVDQVYEKITLKAKDFQDSPMAIANKLNTMEAVLDVSVIKDYPTIESFLEDITKNRRLESHIKSYIPKKLNDQKWHGGGALITINGQKLSPAAFSNINFIAGTGVTITTLDDPNNSRVNFTISATGAAVALYTEMVSLGKTQVGDNLEVNLTLGLAHPYVQGQFVALNGQIIDVSRWSVIGNTMTITSAYTTDSVMIQYS